MLKSIKHDFISTGRIMGVIYAIMAGICIFIVSTKNVQGGTFAIIGSAALMALSLCLLVLTAVVVMLDFQKSLYGDRGYLTFTLPVKSRSILASKVIVSGAWFVIALAAIIGSMWVAFSAVKDLAGEDYEMWEDLIAGLVGKDINSMLGMIIVRVLVLFIEFCFFALVIFFTNTLSNTRYFQKHSIFFTIIFFIPIFFAVYKIGQLANEYLVFSVFFVNGSPKFITDDAMLSVYDIYPSVNVSELLVYIVISIVLFVLTHYLMSKKVNIK